MAAGNHPSRRPEAVATLALLVALAAPVGACGPRGVDVALSQGIAAQRAGDPATSTKHYRNALGRSPRIKGPRTNLAIIALADGRVDDAGRLATEALDLDDDLPEALVLRAVMSARAGGCPQALELASAAAGSKDAPALVRARALTVQAACLAQMPGDGATRARGLLTRAKALAPEDPPVSDVYEAIRRDDQRKLLQGVHDDARAGRLAVDDPRLAGLAGQATGDDQLRLLALRIRAALRSRAGDWEGALADLDAAADVASGSAAAGWRFERAIALAHLKRLDEARAELQKVHAEAPHTPGLQRVIEATAPSR